MTMVVTAISPDAIVMANDCAVVNTFSDGREEFTSGRKHLAIEDVGCITMWGARDGNPLLSRLQSVTHDFPSSIDGLAQEVNRLLIDNYQPHTGPLDDTGYHVAGYDADGNPHVYHVFWNVRRNYQPSDQLGEYAFQHFIPRPGFVLFNGRNDLVNIVLEAIRCEISRNTRTRLRLDSTSSLLQFAHFCLRFGNEITQDVAPPFIFHVLRPGKQLTMITIQDISPVPIGFFDGYLV